jgi:alpha-beta hydrolase superfamily lysophospholipase
VTALTVHDQLQTSDDITLLARHWPASARARAAVVLVHGFSASKDDPSVVAVAEHLAAAGLDVVGYDARGHGGSGGLCTLGDQEHHDVAAAVAAARALSSRVVLVGASMGAIAALRHAAADPSVAGVVTVSSPATWRLPRTLRALFAAGLTQTRPGRWLAARHLNVRLARGWSRPEPPVALVRRIAAPVAVVHGEADRFIPARESRLLAGAAAGPSRLTVVPGMGHAYDPVALPAIAEGIEWALAAGHVGAPT